MANSIVRGKDYVDEWYSETFIDNPYCKGVKVLDVGCGQGIWAGCLRKFDEYCPEIWVGVEIFEPYLTKYKAIHERLYDRIIKEDIRHYKPSTDFDLCIMGDVLEHMTKQDSIYVINKLKKRTKYIVLSYPLNCPPHPAEHGNPYQKHIQDNLTEKDVKNVIETCGLDILRSRVYNVNYINNPIQIGIWICEGELA